MIFWRYPHSVVPTECGYRFGVKAQSSTLGVSCGAPTVRRACRVPDDMSQMKSHEHDDVVDDSAGRGLDGPARLRAKVAMAHAPVVTAVRGRCRREKRSFRF